MLRYPRNPSTRSRRSSFLEWTRRTGADPTWTERTPSRHSGFHLARKFLWYLDSAGIHAIAMFAFGGSRLLSVSSSVSDAHQRDSLPKRWNGLSETFFRPRIKEMPRDGSLWGIRYKEFQRWLDWCAKERYYQPAWFSHCCCFSNREVRCRYV